MITPNSDKLIAEFMGYEYHPAMISTPEHWFKDDKYYHNLNFFHDWNGIMLVVIFIESLGFHMHTHRTPWYKYNCLFDRFSPKVETVAIGDSEANRFDAVYKAVVKFIDWYNKEKTNG